MVASIFGKLTMLTGNKAYLETRKNLPIFGRYHEILSTIRSSQITLIIGETGCGKTTQVCQYLYENGFAKGGKAIVCTQPRRVAAVTVSKRVAEEQGVSLGKEVGYKVRFDEKCSASTKIKFATDGMLLREAISDKWLYQYSTVILDEAHERSLHTDIIIGLLKTIIKKRKDLKIVIMSATISAETFTKFFGQDVVKVLTVRGRMYPVELMYTTVPQEDYIYATANAIVNIHMENPEGDVLAFLTGQEEIESLNSMLDDYVKHFNKTTEVAALDNILTIEALDVPEPVLKKQRTNQDDVADDIPIDGNNEPTYLKMLITPIYSALDNEKQLKVFEKTPPGFRKIILATNIAETSLTIPNIKYVLDTGFVKLKNVNKKTGIESLELHPVSKAQARQRTGRAGRESNGICYRLYTEDAFNKLDEFTPPEIVRSSLSLTVLQLKALGISDVLSFDFIDQPKKITLKNALVELLALGALDKKDGSLTELGRKMSLLPVDPKLAKVLIVSGTRGCTQEMVDLISLISLPNLFYVPFGKRDQANKARMKFFSIHGDHLTYLNALKQYNQHKKEKGWCSDHFINMRAFKQVNEIRKQLIALCGTLKIPILSCGIDIDKILKCLLAGYFQNIAELQDDGSYKTLHDNQSVVIHPSSTLKGKKPKFLLYTELLTTKKKYIRDCSSVSQDWIQSEVPSAYYKRADGP